MRKRALIQFCVVTVWLALSVTAHSEDLYFIDAHSQVDENIELNEVLRLMKNAGVSKMILAARGKRRSRDVAEFAEAHSQQIIAAVRSKSRHYRENSGAYYENLNKQVLSGRYGAIAELLLFHAKKSAFVPEVIVTPDDQRVTAAYEAIKAFAWPIILHLEFAAMSESQKTTFGNGLQEFLNRHANYPVALIHMGQLSAAQAQSLLEKHNNLYFLTSHCNPIALARSNQPWTNLFQGKQLAPSWRKLIEAYPTRFIFALDNVTADHWRNGYVEQVALWRHALNEVAPEVAHALAHKNAERLWHWDW